MEKTSEGSKQWKEEADFNVIFTEPQFSKIDFKNLNKSVIMKIHGTIKDKESIRTTLVAVSRRELREEDTACRMSST